MKREFEHLYKVYVDNFYNNGKHDKSSIPVCYNEFVDNEIPYYEEEYREYLKSIVEDDNFEVKTTEDFETWVETELQERRDKEGNLI